MMNVSPGTVEIPTAAPDVEGNLPDAVVAVYATEADLTAAVKHLEHVGYDMHKISALGTGLTQERHVVGFETKSGHAARWAGWGGLWGGGCSVR